MSELYTYFELTQKLIELYSNKENQERDMLLDESDRILKEREQLLPAITPPFTNDEHEFFRKLQTLEKQLQLLMQSEKQAIQRDMKSFSQTKKGTNKYVNPYENLNIDGVFYDKRK